jgi:hypothetical protein
MATRLYFPASDAAAVTPGFHADWTYTSEALRRRLAHVKGSSAITAGTQIGPWTPAQKALDRQYISTRMAAGVTFTISPGGSYKCNLMVREFATADNVDRLLVGVRVVSEDGNTVRAVLRVPISGNPTEFINNATHRNQRCSTTFIGLATGYTTVLGDRLVVEIGYQDNSGTSPEASAKWGENATDLPENDTQTTDGAGWIEFTDNITFVGEANNQTLTVVAGSYAATGNAATLKWNRLMPFTAGSYSVTGNDVALRKGYRLTIESGAYSTTGQTVNLKADRRLPFSAGSYSISGNSVNLAKGYKLTLDQGSYLVNGNTVNLRFNRKLITELGTYSTTGNNVSLLNGRKISIDPGVYQITGSNVNLTHGQAGAYEIDTEVGSYISTGNSVELRYNRKINTEQGVYSLIGNDVQFTHSSGGYALNVESGTYETVGNDISLSHTRNRARMITKLLYRNFNSKYLGMKNTR